jgi:WD40 repeat protein
MKPLPRRLLALLPLAALLGGPAPLPAAPADDKKPAESVADPLPEGARLRLGSGRFRHGGNVLRIFALPDGKRLLTIAQDGKARVWDVATQKERARMELASQPYAQLYFSVSPDGKTLASANSLDRTIRLWNLADGKEALAFGGLAPNQAFYDLEYSSDGKTLVSSHQDRVYRVWDPVTAKELRQVAMPKAPNFNPNILARVRFTPDDKGLAVVEDWSVRVLDAESGKEVRWFGGHTGVVNALAYSPDGKRMATAAFDRAARVWDVASGKTVAKLPLPPNGGRELAFTADGKSLAVVCNDRTVRLFDIEAAKEVAKVDLGGGIGLTTFALSRDGKSLYASGGEAVLHGYDVATGKELFPVTGHPGGVAALAWSPDGKALATSGSGDHSIILWDVATGKVRHQLPPLDGYFIPTHLQFTPDGKTLLSYGTDRTVRLWDTAEGKERGSFMTAPLPPVSFALSDDGKLAAAATYDRTVRVWDVAAEKELSRPEVPAPANPNVYFSMALSFAGDNRTLLGYSANERLVRRWDARTGKELGTAQGITLPFAGQGGPTSDGRSYLLLQGLTVTLNELTTGRARQTFTLPAPPPPVPGGPPRPFLGAIGAALSPDGRTVATVMSDGTLRFWDSGSGKVLAERKDLPANSRLLAFSPDGKTLATAGTDAGALLWDVPGPNAEGRLALKEITAETAAELWKDVSAEDGARAWQAVLTLAAAPKEAVPFVEKQLKPEAAPDAKAIDKLIAALDADGFQEREDATEALIRAGRAAEDAVKKALANKPSAEAKSRLEQVLAKLTGSAGPNMEEVRAARAVEVLEKIGTPEARKVLEEVAKGADSQLTAEARSGLARVKARNTAP